MSVTEQQARAIAFLAASVRPTGAARWDEAGIFANVMKVADRQLSAVVIAVMQAAEDRKAQNPGVIPSAGPHWRTPESAPARWEPNIWDPAAICTTCSRPEAQCKAVRHADDDHPFISRARNAQETDRPAEITRRLIVGLKEATLDEPPEREKPPATTGGTDHVAPIRAALTTTQPTSAGENERVARAAQKEATA